MDRLLRSITAVLNSEEILGVIVFIVLGLAALAFFFATYAVFLRIAHDRSRRQWELREATWEPLLLNTLSRPEELPKLHAAITDRERLPFVDYLLRFARRVRGEELAVLQRAAVPYLDLVHAQLKSRRIEIRLRAVRTLGVLGLPKYRDSIVQALSDQAPAVGIVAARALSSPEYAEFASDILTNLHRFASWNRGFLSEMMLGMGTEVAPALRWTLADRAEEPWVRAVAAGALARIPDPQAADVATTVISEGQHREIVIESLRLLREVGGTEHLPLVRTQTESKDFAIRSQAYRTLGALGGQEEVNLLTSALDDASPWVAIHAARALHRMGSGDVLLQIASGGGERSEVAGLVLSEGQGVEAET